MARWMLGVALVLVLMMPAAVPAAPDSDGGTGAPAPSTESADPYPKEAPAPEPAPSPSTKPAVSDRPVDDRNPAVNVFRVSYDPPGYRGWTVNFGWGGGWGVGANTVIATGGVWFANDSLDTLRDVKVRVHFWSRRFYRRSNSETYDIGTLNPRQQMSLIYRSWVIPAERVVPYVEVVYRREGDEQLYRTMSWPYGR